MIFFSGWGLLFVPAIAVIGFVASLLAAAIAGAVGVDQDMSLSASFAIGGIVSAALCWWWGRKLNDATHDRIFVDKATGKEVTLKNRHSLMFVPVQYWAFVILAIFLIVAFNPPANISS